MIESRQGLGDQGESIAVAYLRQQGLVIENRNVRVAGGEVDVIVRDGKDRVVVEVRTRTGPVSAMQGLGHQKVTRVKRLAATLGISRVDLMAIDVRTDGIDVRWVRNAS